MIFLACVVFQLDLVIFVLSFYFQWIHSNPRKMLFFPLFDSPQQIRHMGVEITLLLSAGLVATLNLFVYCYFGKMATESFAEMANLVYEANWIDLPIELQKFALIAIINMQKPLVYHGFSVAILNLETFTKVSFTIETVQRSIIKCRQSFEVAPFFQMLKAVLTYYMMFKTIVQSNE